MEKAKWFAEVIVIDPETNMPIGVSMYKHSNGGIFGIDSSYVDQVLGDDDEDIFVADVFSNTDDLKLVELIEE